jgi:hypothetical protein
LNHPNLLEKLSKENKLLLNFGFFETLTNLKILEFNEDQILIAEKQNKLKLTLKHAYVIIGTFIHNKQVTFVNLEEKHFGKMKIYSVYFQIQFSQISLISMIFK